MRRLTWWLRVVGALYLLEGGGLALLVATSPASFAEMWATAPPGSLDPIAVRGTLIAGLPAVLSWLLFGVLMLAFSRTPARADVLVLTVAAWELLVWVPVDAVALAHGFEVARSATLIAIHLAIGISGLLVRQHALRSQPAPLSQAR